MAPAPGPAQLIPARGLTLSCRGWEQEGALRCLLNNLDPAVAERPEDLVVYGGAGKAARDWTSFAGIVTALRELECDETLIVQSGKPVAVVPSHPDAPRVLISSAMLVPAWSTPEDFWALEAAGLTMYGQMTAGGWFYIGTQGILGFTYETFRAVADAHFGGTLEGRRVLTAGLGGMGGAQGLGVSLNGGRTLILEVDPRRARRRADAGWIDLLTDDYRHAIASLDDPAGPASIGLLGNAADLLPRLVRDGIQFDVVTDQTAAHDLLHGYVPAGYTVEAAEHAASTDGRYLDDVRSSIAQHVEGLLELSRRGAIAFEYGNNIRAQARDAGVAEAMEIPGFVAAYVRPILARGVGPYRWIALSGDPEDLRRSEDALMEVVASPTLRKWIGLARRRVAPQGLPARICWLGLGERDAVGLRLNELVRSGEIGPLALGRDHMDPASVASPSRETEGMLDGSDAIADWPILNALLNAASGASWVSVHHGGGVGIGRSIHAGVVIVADGTPISAEKLERVLTNDPGTGVMRHADAGYAIARSTARTHGVRLPSVPAED